MKGPYLLNTIHNIAGCMHPFSCAQIFIWLLFSYMVLYPSKYLIQNNMKILFMINCMSMLIVPWKEDGLITVPELNNKKNCHNFFVFILSWISLDEVQCWSGMKTYAIFIHSHKQFLTNSVRTQDGIECKWCQIQTVQI